MKKLLAFLLTVLIIAPSTFAQFKIIEDVYSTFDGRKVDVFLVEGKFTVVSFDKTRITKAQLEDTSTIVRVVNRIDSLYSFYKSFFGKEPVGGVAKYSFKSSVAFVNPSCGAACGLIGAKGIEVGPDMLNQIFNEQKYPTKTNRIGIVGYEFGRNFFTFGNKILFPYDLTKDEKNGGFAEGFAALPELLSFKDYCENQPPGYSEFQETLLSYDWLVNGFRAYINDLKAGPDSNLQREKFIFDINRSHYGNYYGIYGAALLAGINDVFKNEISWPDFFNALYNAKDVQTKEDAMGNLAFAFSAATKLNLNPFFRNVLKFSYNNQYENAINAFDKPGNRLVRDMDVLMFTNVRDTINLNIRSINHLQNPTTRYIVYLDNEEYSRSAHGNNILVYDKIASKESLMANIVLEENGVRIDSQRIRIGKRERVVLSEYKDKMFFVAGNGNSIPGYREETFQIENISRFENFSGFELIFPVKRSEVYKIVAEVSTKPMKSPDNIETNGDGVIDYWSRISIGGGGGLDGTQRVGYDISRDDSSFNPITGTVNTSFFFNADWAQAMPFVLQRIYLESVGVLVSKFRNVNVYNITDTDKDGMIDFQDNCPLIINPNAPAARDTALCEKAQPISLSVSALPDHKLVWYRTDTFGNAGDTTLPRFSTLSPGAYEFYVSQRLNANGCESKRSKLTVTISKVPEKPKVTKDSDELVSSASAGNQWYFEGSAISGASAQKFKPTQNGNYTVKVTSDGCESEFSEKFNYVITGVIELDNGQYIKLYPNPVSREGNFYINWKLNMIPKIMVEGFDMTGRKILRKSITNDQEILTLPDFGGQYIIKVSWGNGKSQLFTLIKN